MQTIGQKLRATREQRKATLSQAAEATRIKSTQLEMMETDKFDQLGAVIYAKGFLRLYGEFLGLDPEALVRAYLEAHGPQRPTLPHETAPKLIGRRAPPSREFAPETDLGTKPAGYGETGGARGRPGAKGESDAVPRMTLREFLDRSDVRSALRAAGLAAAAILALWLAVEGVRALARRIAERPEAAAPTGLTAVVEEPPDPYLDPQSVRPSTLPARRP